MVVGAGEFRRMLVCNGGHNVGFIIVLGSSWAGRWVSAEVELGWFETCVAQSFPSVSFGSENF